MGFWDTMTGQEIYENFANAPGPDSLMEAQQHLALVEAVYTDREEQIKALAASMEEGWTGAAAGAAQRGAGPLAVAHGGAAQEMATAKGLLGNQADSFYAAKNSVVPVPPVPPAPPPFTNIVTSGSAQIGYEIAVHRSNEAARTNVAAMEGWTSASSYNGTMMPTEYGHIDPNAMNISMTETKASPSIVPIDHGKGGDKVVTPGEGLHSGRSATVPVGNTTKSTSSDPAPKKPAAMDSSEGRGKAPGREATAPDRFQPVAGKTAPDRQTGGTRTSPGTETPDFGGVAGFGSGSGGSEGGSAGSRSGIGGSGSAADRLTGGRGTGAGGPGGAGEPIGRGGVGAAGAKGTGGRPGGMPGMGIGQKGQGTEDEEHQRKYVVEEDIHFQLTDEDGERVVDPRTGMSPTPPVIGN